MSNTIPKYLGIWVFSKELGYPKYLYFQTKYLYTSKKIQNLGEYLTKNVVMLLENYKTNNFV